MLGTPKVKGVSKQKKPSILIVSKISMVNTFIMIKKRLICHGIDGNCSPQANLYQKRIPI
jgi:hypothetical protein